MSGTVNPATSIAPSSTRRDMKSGVVTTTRSSTSSSKRISSRSAQGWFGATYAHTGSSTSAIEANSFGGSAGMITRSAVLTACSSELPSGVSITRECSSDESSVATNGMTTDRKSVVQEKQVNYR